GPSLSVRQRLAVSPAPVSLRVAGDGSRGFVASLWSRQLTVFETTPAHRTGEAGPGLRVGATVPPPFAPREQLPVGGDQLVVADAFGGQLATVDLGRGEVRSVRTLPAHNIRGLALSGDGRDLLVAHQTLNGRANTSFDDVHWGNLITNVVRA